MNTSHYALIEQQELLYCFSLRDDQWHAIPLHGEIGTDISWDDTFKILTEIHNGSKKLQDARLLVIVDNLDTKVLEVITQNLKSQDAEQWQLHSLGWLTHLLPEQTAAPTDWFTQQLLPSVVSPETIIESHARWYFSSLNSIRYNELKTKFSKFFD